MRALNTERHRTYQDTAVTYGIGEGGYTSVWPKGASPVTVPSSTALLTTTYGNPGFFQDTSPTYSPSLESTDDNVTPDYDKRQKAGEIIMNDYQHSESQHLLTPGTLSATIDPWNGGSTPRTDFASGFPGNLVSPSVLGPYLVPAPSKPIDTLVDLALTKAYANLSDAEMLLGVTIAELHKTVRMITDTAGQACSLLQRETRVLRQLKAQGVNVERGSSIPHIRKLLRSTIPSVASLASKWLTIRYGWRPLVYEVIGGIEAFKAIGNKHLRSRITGSVLDGDDMSLTTTTDWFNTKIVTNSVQAQAFVQHTRYNRASAGLIIQSKLDNIDTASILGTNEMLASAWELIPYSFVIDWFLNTSDYVTSWQPRMNLEVLGSWVSIEERNDLYYTLTACRNRDYPTLASAASGSENHHHLVKTRYANPARPVIPHVNVRLDWGKCVDLLALTKNILRSSKWKV